MPYYRRNAPADDPSRTSTPVHEVAARKAGTLRRLKPLAGVQGDDPAEPVYESAAQLAEQTGQTLPEAQTLPAMTDGDTLKEQAAALLPRAAGILDEEMARGALDAAALRQHTGSGAGVSPMDIGRSASGMAEGRMPYVPPPSGFPAELPAIAPNAGYMLPGTATGRGLPGPDPMALSSTALNPLTGLGAGSGEGLARDLQGFVERFAAALPGRGGQYNADGGLPKLQPKGPVGPGQSTYVSLRVHNDGSSLLMLRPLCTALIGEQGGQIAAHCVCCAPTELSLAPGQHALVDVTLMIPAATPPGQYTGLLVVAGMKGLQALLCVDVRLGGSGTP